MGQFFSWVARGSTAPDGSWFRMQTMGVPYPGLLNQDLSEDGSLWIFAATSKSDVHSGLDSHHYSLLGPQFPNL